MLTDPECPLIGKLRVHTYPIREAQGILFVFVGDVEPPELADDLAPGFLDPDMAIAGMRRPIVGNWRLATENGFDTTHIYIHRHSGVVTQTDAVLPLGFIPQDKHSMEIVEGPSGPKGVVDALSELRPDLQAPIGDVTGIGGAQGGRAMVAPGCRAGCPERSSRVLEGYYIFSGIAIDEKNPHHFQVLGKRVKSEEERRAHQRRRTATGRGPWRGFTTRISPASGSRRRTRMARAGRKSASTSPTCVWSSGASSLPAITAAFRGSRDRSTSPAVK